MIGAPMAEALREGTEADVAAQGHRLGLDVRRRMTVSAVAGEPRCNGGGATQGPGLRRTRGRTVRFG